MDKVRPGVLRDRIDQMDRGMKRNMKMVSAIGEQEARRTI